MSTTLSFTAHESQASSLFLFLLAMLSFPKDDEV